MRELSTCDFCAGAAAGVYEVVPDDVAGVHSRRMVLCGDCRDTLADVVDPLLDQLRLLQAGGAEPPGESDAEPDVAPGDREPRERAPDVRTDAADADPTDAAPEPTRATDGASSARTGEQRRGAAESEDGATTATPAASAADADAGAAETAAETGARSEDPVDPGGTRPTEPASHPAERPPGYRKVVRLLENRDTAIPRSDLEDLVTNAYDVTAAEFQAAVDAAIENGHLEATNDGLRRAD